MGVAAVLVAIKVRCTDLLPDKDSVLRGTQLLRLLF